jgi:hypothetical protein
MTTEGRVSSGTLNETEWQNDLGFEGPPWYDERTWVKRGLRSVADATNHRVRFVEVQSR